MNVDDSQINQQQQTVHNKCSQNYQITTNEMQKLNENKSQKINEMESHHLNENTNKNRQIDRDTCDSIPNTSKENHSNQKHAKHKQKGIIDAIKTYFKF